ncbi:MAG: hypothetical protein WC438_06100 [Candidatus Pacearchaeota archaeon]
MEKEEHIKRHIELHKSLDELVADYIKCTEKILGHTSIIELMIWSADQTKKPTDK